MSLGQRLLPKRAHEVLQFERTPIKRWILRQVIPLLKPGMMILDAGSGSLAEQHNRNDYLQTGATLHTCDFCASPGLTFTADLHQMPVADATYDVVICTQVLEHVRDPRQVCRELFRILKPGGRLFVSAPQGQYLHNLPYHYFNITRIGLDMIAREAGFEVESTEPQGGHFVALGVQLHFTCRVIRSHMTTPQKRALLFLPLLACQLLFGLLTKVICLFLDRWDKDPLNTLGWMLVCRRPVAAA